MESQDSALRTQRLIQQILQDARAHDYSALLAADADPETEGLLRLVSERESLQARQHLRGARIWRAQQTEKIKGKLDAAQTALNEFDLALARGILRKIDSSILDEQLLVRFDELLLSVEARAVELEDLQSRLPTPPDQKTKPRKRFRKR